MHHCAFGKKSFLAVILVLLSSSFLSYAAEQSGTVQSGRTPIRSSFVTLYSASNSQNGSPVVLGTAQTNANGSFSIAFTWPSDKKTVLYLIADGGQPVSGLSAHNPPTSAIRLATVLGSQPIPKGVVINERTTIAAAYAMAQFISGSKIAGRSPGLQNAAATTFNLVNPVTGEIGSVLGSSPNGLKTSTMREFNSLANLLATCIEADTLLPCRTLFALATPPRGPGPRDTLQAVVNVAHNPWKNPKLLFLQSILRTPYSPALLLPPDAWTLAIVYDGNGHEFDGPGNMAFDSDGNVWSTNNYEFNSDPLACVPGGRQVLKLTPTGADAPNAPYSGGGLYGAGFGISIDPMGNTWVGNFGFQGVEDGINCDPDPPATSVSKFNANGTAISPSAGYTQGEISQPQGTVSDRQGNIWIANCGNNSITKYPGGNPAQEKNFHDLGLVRPFDIAIDGDGNAWITSSGNNTVVGLTPAGKMIDGSPIDVGEQEPFGIAVDSLGNIWTANTGVLDLPCGDNKGGGVTPSNRPSITKITRSGDRAKVKSFNGGGLLVPWSIAIDGDDNVWVANFAGQRLAEFCGARTSNCPNGYQTGDPISPKTGYSSDALTRNTGVAIDPSGNVWLANNWRTASVQTNPGGNGLVVFIGLAAPVKTPLIGPPQQP